VDVKIDFERVARNAEQIRQATKVPIHAVVKADAYGVGAREVARSLADIVQGFCVFSLDEAREIDLWGIAGKPILSIGPPGNAWADEFLAAHVRPAISSAEEANRLRNAGPVLSVDTGMQRFACGADQLEEVLSAGRCREAFTHSVRPEQVKRLVELVGGRGLTLHAAGSSLLDNPACWLDGVRPGLALYRGAVTVRRSLVEVRESRGPVGYTGFVVPRHGVILGGYSSGLRPGPCVINGRRSRVIEVGMQSSFVEAGAGDKLGDYVTILGEGLEADEIGRAWGCSAQQVLVSLLKNAE
jgi:alanine racemase